VFKADLEIWKCYKSSFNSNLFGKNFVTVLKNYQHGILWQSSHKPSSISTWNFSHLRQNENSYFNSNSSPTEVFIKLLYTPSHLRIYMWKIRNNHHLTQIFLQKILDSKFQKVIMNLVCLIRKVLNFITFEGFFR